MLRHLWVCTACVTASVLFVTPALADEDLQGPIQVRHAPPVDGPITDHFRAPAARWAAGNRGIDYETTPGEAVLASADGTVEFAGQVGGT
jgi:murein DD-endopeptidase MepM/ murein hydrolase activator NlpD